jgi:phage terminase large subunit-like protein
MKIATRLERIERTIESRERDSRMRRSLSVLQSSPTRLFDLLGMDRDPWQIELLNTLSGVHGDTPRRTVLCCGRQTGKSTTLSLFAAWSMVCRGWKIAITAPSYRQGLELSQKTRRIIQRLGLVSITRESITDLELANGGRLLVLSSDGSTGRGFTLDALLVDEAAYLGNNSDLIESLSPALSLADGLLILASSPGPPVGMLHSAWTSDDWHKVQVRCDQCSRIDPEFLERQRELLGDAAFRREYLAEFVDLGGVLIGHDAVERCRVASYDHEWIDFD